MNTCRDCAHLIFVKTADGTTVRYKCDVGQGPAEDTLTCAMFVHKDGKRQQPKPRRHPMTRDLNKSDWGISATATLNFSGIVRSNSDPFCPSCEYLKPTLARDGFDCTLLDKDSDLWIPRKWVLTQEMAGKPLPAWCPRLNQLLDTSSCFTCVHIRGQQLPIQNGAPAMPPAEGWCSKHKGREVSRATSMKSCYLWEPNKDLIHPCSGYNSCVIDEETGLCTRCGTPEGGPTFWDPTVKQ
jgi:hypothetical protein